MERSQEKSEVTPMKSSLEEDASSSEEGGPQQNAQENQVSMTESSYAEAQKTETSQEGRESSSYSQSQQKSKTTSKIDPEKSKS